MLELVMGVLLTAGAVYFVLIPVLRPRLGSAETGDDEQADEGDDPDDDFGARAVALRALKEIEFDRATGKLSDADYDMLRVRYTTEALAALRAESGETALTPGASPGMREPRAVARGQCPTHGPRAEAEALFCSECGRRLASAPGYCARCGVSLEREAKYCHSCGARVAA